MSKTVENHSSGQDGEKTIAEHARPPQSQYLGSTIASKASHIITIFWRSTRDDMSTVLGPTILFGLCGVLSGPIFINLEDHVQPLELVIRLPSVVFFVWSTLLVFQLSNQRLPEAVIEDSLNKPWRPIPSGLVTPIQIRRALLLIVPIVWACNYLLDVAYETALLTVLFWLYSDLGGGDENCILRNAIISAGYGLWNLGSIKVASGRSSDDLTSTGATWIFILTGVALTTMHMQDLRDQQGDRSRGRQTAPIVLGDRLVRWAIAGPVIFWSLFCTYYWEARIWAAPGLVVVTPGLVVAIRCLTLGGPSSDRLTWHIWGVWIASLYALPCIQRWYGY
ncbi:UbiA prenyltransferase family-domain-containing protein [Xylaria bambusicola]|uniref:UbiA prenyltransferase family-domain-containing protein n=1 Tax=Xylaria bambusicola TaxID=326684 RepID=UPI002008E0D3|nr:UbiA prenyltransferase family-domain-containing protein [Xylaria bambusicola]KAI0521173.1 UbiA prenyltransferase family-domain-containing protein [Xylaria bambusicola]